MPPLVGYGTKRRASTHRLSRSVRQVPPLGKVDICRLVKEPDLGVCLSRNGS